MFNVYDMLSLASFVMQIDVSSLLMRRLPTRTMEYTFAPSFQIPSMKASFSWFFITKKIFSIKRKFVCFEEFLLLTLLSFSFCHLIKIFLVIKV